MAGNQRERNRRRRGIRRGNFGHYRRRRVESGERIIYFEESGEIGRGKNWREVRGTGMGKGEGGRLRKAHKATVVGGEGCLAADIYELNYSEMYDFTLTNNIHVIYD